MLRIKARVHGGRLTVDQPYDAPEGAEVDLVVIDDGDSLDADERRRLHEALLVGHEQAARGDVVPADEVLAKLRSPRR